MWSKKLWGELNQNLGVAVWFEGWLDGLGVAYGQVMVEIWGKVRQFCWGGKKTKAVPAIMLLCMVN